MDAEKVGKLTPRRGDALVIVDVQRDFLPGGSLAVAGGDRVVAPLNRCIRAFHAAGLPVFATRDWHPADHCSFRDQGGPWPPHCVANSAGAAFAADLQLPGDVGIVSKATHAARDAYSGFGGTDLAQRLRALQVTRLVIGGLATDYCVRRTVEDACELGFDVRVLADAIAAVDAQPGDGERAIEAMRGAGARFVETDAACGA